MQDEEEEGLLCGSTRKGALAETRAKWGEGKKKKENRKTENTKNKKSE